MAFLQFIRTSITHVLTGSKWYWAWVSFLCALIVWGVLAYLRQLDEGLIMTGMRDQVPWGFYIGNFTFLVGVAAAAVVLVIPAYVYNWKPIKEIVIIGELLAVAALVMCLGFVFVDIGRPDRLWHVIPMLGNINFPQSILAWDVVVLNLYLVVNFVVATHLIFRSFQGRKPNLKLVVPLVLFSIPLAVSIHTVTAFLYSGLAARPFWNASILAPRFLASAFCSGPAIILILLQILRKTNKLDIRDEAIWKIAELMAYAIAINLFLLAAEVFKEYYSATEHLMHTEYLWFGIGDKGGLGVYAWSSLIAMLVAFVIFLVPATRKNWVTLNVGCVALYFGVYVEKGIGLVIPGLVPDTLGEVYTYHPTTTEISVAAGIFGIGFLLFTLMVKVAVPMALGDLQYKHRRAPADPS